MTDRSRDVTPIEKPTRAYTPEGYIRVKAPGHPMARPNGWALEHRVVAYDQGWLTGRTDNRHVHHINHVKDDNRPENLCVVTTREHGEHHQRVDWSRAASMYRGGLSTPQIARELGTHPALVSRRLRRMGVEMRTLSESVRLAHAARRAGAA